MLSALLDHLSLFPAWQRQPLTAAGGTFLFVLFVTGTIRALQTGSMKACYAWITRIATQVSNRQRREANDPLEWQRTTRILDYFGMGLAYTMAGLLLVIVVSFAILWGISAPRLSITQHAVVLPYIFLCAHVGGILKAQGGRELIKLRSNRSTSPQDKRRARRLRRS